MIICSYKCEFASPFLLAITMVLIYLTVLLLFNYINDLKRLYLLIKNYILLINQYLNLVYNQTVF